jgi:hypothetical protein
VTEDPESPAPAVKEPEGVKSFWASFSRADMRTLVVTIAGTLIGGILGVMAVAVAIIVARYMLRPTPQSGVLWIALAAGSAGMLLQDVNVARQFGRRMAGRADPAARHLHGHLFWHRHRATCSHLARRCCRG